MNTIDIIGLSVLGLISGDLLMSKVIKDQRPKGFWMALAIIFILSFLISYAVADEPVQIPVEDDFFIGQIVNVNVGYWTTGQIVDYDGSKDLYEIIVGGFYKNGLNTLGDGNSFERTGKQISSRSNGRSPKRNLEVLPDNPPIQNIKAEVKEIKPEFKFNLNEEIKVASHSFNTFLSDERIRIVGRAVLWGENFYKVQRDGNGSAWDGQIHRLTLYDIVSEEDVRKPEKEQPEHIEGLQP